MSCDHITGCPECKWQDPDAVEGYPSGSVSVYVEANPDDWGVKVSFSCGMCGWRRTIKEGSLPTIG